MAAPHTRTIPVPPVLQTSPHWQAHPNLTAKNQIQTPVDPATLAAIRHVEHSAYSGFPTSTAQQAAATRLVAQVQAEDTHSQPIWVQALLDGQERTNTELNRVNTELNGLKENVRTVMARQAQADVIMKNAVLCSINAPLLPVPILPSESGIIPSLPRGFDPSSLASIRKSDPRAIDRVINLYGLPMADDIGYDRKTKGLFKFFGGSAKVTVMEG